MTAGRFRARLERFRPLPYNLQRPRPGLSVDLRAGRIIALGAAPLGVANGLTATYLVETVEAYRLLMATHDALRALVEGTNRASSGDVAAMREALLELEEAYQVVGEWARASEARVIAAGAEVDAASRSPTEVH